MKARLIFALLLGSLLVACSADMGELNQWMEQQKREAKPTIKPLVPPKKFLPQPYEASAGVDPYSPQKLSVAIKQEAAQPNSLLSAEMNRRREPLESYPLDSMAMVGSMMRQGQRYALLRADNLLYRVKDGEHLGLNFGRVMKISETDITLREVVQDAAGEWVERTSTLQLQEQGR
ncbi:pilus assembly protein PilP [Roseateles oligotrophus]|uniref:Pilus assembly protein PilP n=1 Tax=Roseateles oligotrophus TaxID=1769250 RepID=A0ABT2YEQ8_9BURK|nr:pilus assembly protein PilP [Roseateles oligotrophus]MCV2368522.1 pilus assembly protein PilP [Roseateles oligotrophus]